MLVSLNATVPMGLQKINNNYNINYNYNALLVSGKN